MIKDLPVYIPLGFGLITITVLLLLYQTIKQSPSGLTRTRANPVLYGLTTWLLLQAAITLSGFYSQDPTFLPPKIILTGILPTILVIIALLVTRKGQQFSDSLPLAGLTYLHIVRIPVELVLWGLSVHKAVPQLMTFEGRNFDILSGITAPFIAYLGLRKLNRGIVLAWHFICLALLVNIVVNALLSSPSPMQQFAFEQPNIAITRFPFSWLPVFIVPVVLFAHLAAIRQLVLSPGRTNR